MTIHNFDIIVFLILIAFQTKSFVSRKIRFENLLVLVLINLTGIMVFNENIARTPFQSAMVLILYTVAISLIFLKYKNRYANEKILRKKIRTEALKQFMKET